MSLYSSQLVVAARQQLSKQLQQKAALQNHQTAKIEKHRPYHYGQTVHQKCKHHGQTKQGLIHKKIHEHIDHAKEKQNQLEHAQNHRRLEDERQEISAEMKKWTKVIEKCLSGQHKFTEKQLHEQHSGFYKWMLFVEELFRHYQNSLKTQTSIHNLDHQQHKSDKLLGQLEEILPSPKVQHKNNDPHQIKLPHLPTKQRVYALQARVSQLEKQLQLAHANDKAISKKIHEVQSTNKIYQQKERVRQQKLQKLQFRLNLLLNEVEGFNNKLLVDLEQPDKLKGYPQLIHSQLGKINEFKKSLALKAKE